MQWQAIEIFSGVGNVSAALKSHGIKTCSYDIVLEGKLMNFCAEAGFASESQYVYAWVLVYNCRSIILYSALGSQSTSACV